MMFIAIKIIIMDMNGHQSWGEEDEEAEIAEAMNWNGHDTDDNDTTTTGIILSHLSISFSCGYSQLERKTDRPNYNN